MVGFLERLDVFLERIVVVFLERLVVVFLERLDRRLFHHIISGYYKIIFSTISRQEYLGKCLLFGRKSSRVRFGAFLVVIVGALEVSDVA